MCGGTDTVLCAMSTWPCCSKPGSRKRMVGKSMVRTSCCCSSFSGEGYHPLWGSDVVVECVLASCHLYSHVRPRLWRGFESALLRLWGCLPYLAQGEHLGSALSHLLLPDLQDRQACGARSRLESQLGVCMMCVDWE
jgi:hypothetical protein